MFLHSWHPHPDIMMLGSFHLRWYGLCLALGAIAAIWVVQILAKRYQLNVDRIFDATLIILISGFIGARLYHVSNEWAYYQAHPTDVWRVWNGGLAMHGGLLAGAIALIVICWRWKWNPWLLADIAAPAVAVGQVIGRWGNYFNQELFGKPTGLPWGIPIDILNRPAQYLTANFFHPTFLYESLGNLIIAGLLWWLHTRRWRQPSQAPKVGSPGSIALTYIICYGILRLSVELLRVDRTPIIGGVRLPILVSGAAVLIATLLFIIRTQRHHANT